jgi:hypothetical protein
MDHQQHIKQQLESYHYNKYLHNLILIIFLIHLQHQDQKLIQDQYQEIKLNQEH